MKIDIREESLRRSAEAKNTEHDKEFPCDVQESRRNEQANGKIEEPVANTRETLGRGC